MTLEPSATFVLNIESAPVLPTDDAVPLALELAPQQYPITFTGSGSEYFRIWIVNLMLTIVTLGIYSAWAKVRKQKYFHRNTYLNNVPLDYHGKPIPILIGRVLMLVFGVSFQFIHELGFVGGVAFAAVVVALVPWLIWKSLRFKLHNTSYRALPFRFTGTLKDAYWSITPTVALYVVPSALILLLAPKLDKATGKGTGEVGNFFAVLGLIYIAGALLFPLAHYCLKRYQHNHYAWASLHSHFDAKAGAFYGQWMRYILKTLAFVLMTTIVLGIIMLVGAGFLKLAYPYFAASGIFGKVILGLFGIVTYTLVLGIAQATYIAAFQSRFQNYVWNHTTAQGAQCHSQLEFLALAWRYVKNAVLTGLTLGFYWPFAVMNITKMKLEAGALHTTAPLMSLVASHMQAAGSDNAVGEAAADFFDFDIAI